MPIAGGFVVRIETEDRQSFTEYQVKTNGNQTDSYIISKTGEHFSIFVGFPLDPTQHRDPKVAYAFEAHVDGQRVSDQLLGRVGSSTALSGIMRGLIVKDNIEAPFLFGTTSVTGEPEI